MAKRPITMIIGDSPTFLLEITDSAGVAIDITLYDIYFSVKKSINDTNYVIQKYNTPTGMDKLTPYTDGKAHVIFNTSDTASLSKGKYVYDVEIRDTTDPEKKYTIIEPSDFILELGVTVT